LISSHLDPITRSVLERRGLTNDVLITAKRQGPTPAPPIGRRLIGHPVIVGRDRVLAVARRRLRADGGVVLVGPSGVGKAALARALAIDVAPTVIEVDLGSIDDAQLDDLGRFVEYVRAHSGAVVVTNLGWTSAQRRLIELIPIDQPLIVTTTRSTADVTVGGRRLRRVVVAPLSPADARRAALAWANEPGRQRFSPDAIETAVTLAARFESVLGGVLPGSAIDVLSEAARDSATAKSGVVTAHAVETTFARLSGIPAVIVSDTERRRLLGIEAELAKRVIGQREAISVLVRAIRRRLTLRSNQQRPIGAFLFVGPTGVGKTELARALAASWFGDPVRLIKFDMGEFMERHEVAKFQGSPPGYVGHDEEGQLIKAVKRLGSTGGVLLLDEIEKAHPAVSDYLLAALDDGRITSNKGETLSLAPFVVIMTSNLGADAEIVARRPGLGFGATDAKMANQAAIITEHRDRAIRERFRPEFLNRLDAIVHFRSLGEDDLGAILDLRLADLTATVERYGLRFLITERLRQHLITSALASGMGARDLVLRQLPRLVEDRLADAILTEYTPGASILIDVDGVTIEPPPRQSQLRTRRHH
jgi:MoxR-like ATPase